MSRVSTFFRHCPACGKRFEIRLVERSEREEESEPVRVKEYAPTVSERRESAMMLEPESPTTVEVTEVEEVTSYRYSYACGHCGHVWSEEQFRRDIGRANPEYKGD